MKTSAFVNSFTGVSLSSKPTLTTSVSSRRSNHSRTGTAPVAILGSRTAATPYGAQQSTQKFTVKVMAKDRCTLVEVDRDTNLRQALLDSKVDLYTLGGKLRNCGGAGQCGTCLISVEDGVYNTNGRTPREEHLLQDRPDSFRLACRTLVHGDVTIRTKPKS